MGGFALKGVFHGDEARAPRLPVGHAEVVGHVGEDAKIDVVEIAVAGEEGLGAHQFLRDAGPQDERAGNALARHDVLNGKRRHDVERYARIVALAVTRRARHDGVVVGYARFLAGFGNAVYIAAQCDDRLAAAPGCPPGRGHARNAVGDREAVLF